MPPLVIETEIIPQECSDWLAERCDLHICPVDTLRFEELLPRVEGMVIRTYTEVNRQMIESAPKLRVVGRAGAGIDNIDQQACADHGVAIVHTPEANVEAVVEFVLAKLLPLLRPISRIETPIDMNEWAMQREIATSPAQFNEMTLGIVGFGRVGSRLGRLARGVGFHVLFRDIKQIEETFGCEQVPLETLLQDSHAISIHVDGRPENKDFVDASFLGKMKQGAIFMNTSRGFVVDAHALANHLRHDTDSSAVLDVHNPEPITETYPLLGLSNAMLYPHVAAKTMTAMLNMGWVVKDVDAVLRGKEPRFQVYLRSQIDKDKKQHVKPNNW